MKSLEELIETKEPAWPLVLEAQKSASNKVEILPPNPVTRCDALTAFQMTTWSTAGAVVYESGGMLVDHGWLRVLGSGHPRLTRSLPQWTTEMTGGTIEKWPYFLIADDALGGFYAVDLGALGAPLKVFYFAPDTFSWENMGFDYDVFIRGFCMNHDLDQFYSTLRWSGWQDDVANITSDQAFITTPPLCMKGAIKSEQNSIWSSRNRRAAPIADVFAYAMDLGKQLDNVPDGTPVQLKFE